MAKWYLLRGSVKRPVTVSGPWNSKGQANRELRELLKVAAADVVRRAKLRVETRES